MNNMKKALALVMSLALAASTFVVGAAYDDVPENHENRIAINLLGDLGVMVGDAGTNDFRPEGTLKRSEAAAIVYRLRTGKTNADSYIGSTGFADVSDSHWASGYINYCVEQGIIAGYPDGTFKPDQEVTYAEYIKMVVCALNLQKVETTTYIDMNTGVLVSEDKITTNYPNGYIVLASDQQITEGIDYLSPNDKITRAEVAQGAYNAIFESYYKINAKDADYVKDKDNKYQHLAEQVFKLYRVDGEVTAFEEYGAGGQEANTFEVNGKAYEYKDFDPALVGQRVYVWQKIPNQTSATDPYVVAVVAHEDNTVTTINTLDLKKDSGDFYYTNADGKKQTIKADTELEKATIMLNGKTVALGDLDLKDVDGGSIDSVAKLLNAVAECRIPVDLTFIDCDNSPKSPTTIAMKVYAQTEITSVTDDKLYVKNIDDTYTYNDILRDHTAVTVYEGLVNAVDSEEIFDNEQGSIDLLNDDDTVNTSVKYYDGIAKEDKVMIYTDVNGIVDIRKVEEVTGTVTAMSNAKFRLDDTEVYVMAGTDLRGKMTTNNNSDAVAYIDPFTGYVINVDEGVGTVEDYYYVHLVQKQYATSNDYQLTAYDYEGNKVTLTFKDTAAQNEVLAMLGKAGVATDPNMMAHQFAVVDAIGVLEVNSKGQIIGWKNNNIGFNIASGVNDKLIPGKINKDTEYNAKTGYVNISGDRVEVKPSSVVFGVTFDDEKKEKVDEVKTYVGSFPTVTADNVDVVYYKKANDDDLKAGLISGTKTKGGNTEFTNVTGYVLDASFEYTDKDAKKGYAIYKLATKGEIKEYQTEVTDDTALRDLSLQVKGCMIMFDLTTDGKILYNDVEDIEVMESAGYVGEKPETFKDVVENNNLTDFDAFNPSKGNMDEDDIYYGIVVESKDGKYIQLVDTTAKADGKYDTIYVDYADDVKVYRISDTAGKWDAATVRTTGGITDSNDQYTTYAAVRIADADDENKARVTEVYTKTIENAKLTGTSAVFFATVKAAGYDIASGEATVIPDETMPEKFAKVAAQFKDATMYAGASQAYATEAGLDLTIESDDPTVVSVDGTTVTAEKAGKTSIKAIISAGEIKQEVTVDITVMPSEEAEATATAFMAKTAEGYDMTFADLLDMDAAGVNAANADEVAATLTALKAEWATLYGKADPKDAIATLAGMADRGEVDAKITELEVAYELQANALVAQTLADLKTTFATSSNQGSEANPVNVVIAALNDETVELSDFAAMEKSEDVTLTITKEAGGDFTDSSATLALNADGIFEVTSNNDESGHNATFKIVISAEVEGKPSTADQNFFVKISVN